MALVMFIVGTIDALFAKEAYETKRYGWMTVFGILTIMCYVFIIIGIYVISHI
jgi:hypothetical protein